jgi:site-specific recombinase XerC
MPKHTKMVARPVRSLEQMQALHEVSAPFGVRTREYALLRLLYVVRLRPGELLARCRSVGRHHSISRTIYKGTVRSFTKTTRQGEVLQLPLTDMAVEALTEWSNDMEHRHGAPSVGSKARAAPWQSEGC